MVQGSDPTHPAAPQAPTNDQPADALGFEAAPKQEKYNTQYLTQNLNKSRRTSQLIIVGVVVAAVLGIALWVMSVPKSKVSTAKPAAAAAAAAAPAAPAAHPGPAAAAPQKGTK